MQYAVQQYIDKVKNRIVAFWNRFRVLERIDIDATKMVEHAYRL